MYGVGALPTIASVNCAAVSIMAINVYVTGLNVDGKIRFDAVSSARNIFIQDLVLLFGETMALLEVKMV